MKIFQKIANIGMGRSKASSSTSSTTESKDVSKQGPPVEVKFLPGDTPKPIATSTGNTNSKRKETMTAHKLKANASTSPAGDTRVKTLSEKERLQQEEHLSIGREYFRLLNAHDIDGTSELTLCDDVVHTFYDQAGAPVNTLSQKCFVVEIKKLFASFPDFSFTHTVEPDPERPDRIILRRAVVCGHHTGAPFALGPYPAIEATGKFVKNDPIDSYLTFHDGKICSYDAYARGPMTGPAGVYTQLGGFPLV